MDALHCLEDDASIYAGPPPGAAGGGYRAMVLAPQHPDRESLQRFIAERYARVYGARVQQFAAQLVGVRDTADRWLAGVGYTPAGTRKLFIEQYLDDPIEHAIAGRIGIDVRRDQVVEVGNLAAVGTGAARRVIHLMARTLDELSLTWVVFTSTRSLLNSFMRLGIATIGLARADRGRLSDRGASWGSYYDADPQVMAANIPLGLLHLRSTQSTASCGR